jgi:transcriptional regulator with XRE-family HTH domain
VALFFDHIWFDNHLEAIHLTRNELAQRSGISRSDLDLMFKDQLEISADILHAWSRIMGVTGAELAKQSGFRGSLERELSVDDQIADLRARVSALEVLVANLIKPPNEGS